MNTRANHLFLMCLLLSICFLCITACRTDRADTTISIATPQLQLESQSVALSEPRSQSTSTSSPEPTQTDPPTDTPRPIRKPTDKPTRTIRPSRTPRPTNTVRPTATDTATPKPTDTATPDPITPIDLLIEMSDETVAMIEGNVVLAESFSRGFKLTIADESGRVTLLIWENVYDALSSRNTLNVGATVRVEGEVGRYEGELQLVPSNSDQIIVKTPAYAWGELAQISQLREKIDQRVMVEGAVSRSRSSEHGTTITVNDGSGEIDLFIWHNIFSRMPNQAALKTADTSLRIVGIVGEYRGNLQLLPALPYDVVVR